jgi:hypothetical protein
VGVLLGFAFLTKMMQAFTVVPAFGLAYLIAAPTPLRRRLLQLLGSLGALLVAGGWWVAIVSLVPAADRPFIDGSPDNSIWNLIFVYNGFGRLSGGTGGANFSGTAGVFRLFNDLMGGQASWLLPASLVGLAGILIARRHAPRTDRVRAAAIIWGGWVLVTGSIFSYGTGVIHTYYTVALAPAIAALVAIGAHQLWLARHAVWSRLTAALMVACTSAWAWVLLDRSPSWHPAIRWVVVITGALATLALVAFPLVRRGGRWAWGAVAALVLASCLFGPVAYSAQTIGTGHTGSIPSAGPTVTGGQGGGLGGQGGGAPGATGSFTGRPGGSTASGGFGASSGTKTRPVGSASGRGGRPTGDGGARGGGASVRQGGSAPTGAGGAAGMTTSTALVRLLEHDATAYRWVAAVEGSQSAASIELATSGDAVMAIGGFNGQGGNLSLAAFEKYVAAGDIHYYIGGTSSGGGPGGNASSGIATWVADHFKAVTVGGETVYNLTEAK